MCAASARSGQPSKTRVDCPRCGYDLRGVVGGWVGSCPIEGTCAECGLTFEWGRLLRPVLAGLDWCVEFVSAKQRRRAIPGTWWRALRPGRFYRDLRMTHDVRPRRLLLFAACLILAIHVPVAAMQTGWAWKDWSRRSRMQGTSFAPRAARAVLIPWIPDRTWRRPAARRRYEKMRKQQAWLAGAAALAAAPPLLLLMLPISMRLARVRPRHLLRVGVYNASWVPIAAMTEMIGAAGVIADQPSLLTFAVIARFVIWPVILASWWIALKRYLLLREPIVVVATSVNGVLGALAAAAVVCTDALADPILMVLRSVLGL